MRQKEIDRQMDIEIQTDRGTGTMHTDRDIDSERHRDTNKYMEQQTGRQTNSETGKQVERQTNGEID